MDNGGVVDTKERRDNDADTILARTKGILTDRSCLAADGKAVIRTRISRSTDDLKETGICDARVIATIWNATEAINATPISFPLPNFCPLGWEVVKLMPYQVTNPRRSRDYAQLWPNKAGEHCLLGMIKLHRFPLPLNSRLTRSVCQKSSERSFHTVNDIDGNQRNAYGLMKAYR